MESPTSISQSLGVRAVISVYRSMGCCFDWVSLDAAFAEIGNIRRQAR